MFSQINITKNNVNLSFCKKLKELLFLLVLLNIYQTLLSGQQLDLVVQTGHLSSVSEVAYSPNGEVLASASWDNTVKLWNVKTGQLIKSLHGHTAWVWSVTFSPDGDIIASGSRDGTIKLWDVKTGNELNTLSGHNDFVQPVSFSPDGKLLASGGRDNTVRLWSIESGQQINFSIAHTDWIYTLAFSPDGKTLATGGRSNYIKFWDIETRTEIKFNFGHDKTVLTIAFSPDGETFASGGSDNSIKLWSLRSKEEIKSFLGHKDSVYSVRFSPDGKNIVSGSNDDTIKLWNIETGKEIEIFKPQPHHTQGVHSVIYSPDGKTLASGSFDHSIRFWDSENGKHLRSIDGNASLVDSVAFSPVGEILAFGSRDNTIKLWDFKAGKLIKSLFGHTDLVESVTYSPDGTILASGGYDNTIRLWDARTGQRIKTLIGSGVIKSLAFSPDGKTLASGGSDNTIEIWIVRTGHQIDSLISQYGAVNSLSFSPFKKTIASGSIDNTVKLWNANTGKELFTLKGHLSSVYTVAFSPDGETIASGSDDTTVKLWSIRTGEELFTLNGHFNSVDSVTFHPKGEFLVSGGSDATMNIWDLQEKKLLATLVSLDKDDWAVITSEGRFDTNKSLDRMEDMHWVIQTEILKPLPIDVFMRQYYEPGLLQRVLKCTEEETCPQEFKPLPSINEINRVQPKVVIKEINLVKNASGLADVTVEVESVTEDVSISATDRDKKEKKTSKAFDLRLFRDGQLVGVSTPRDKLEPFIKKAPELIEQNKKYFEKSGKLTNTPEDVAWREANDIFALVGQENVKRISKDKIEYTFRNVRLPKSQANVEFSAYAFNSDKVKSTTTEPFKFAVPKTVANLPKKGRAFVVSIGVNASETKRFDLQYASNDARKMQEIIGGKLKTETDKYSEVIQIPLISDHKTNNYQAVNTAQKEFIKGVFSLMSGKSYQDVLADIKKAQNDTNNPKLLKEFESIPNIKNLKQVEPEDTLIISFSGHGYADTSGIFYLLPNDIGKDFSVKTKSLNKMISSDELSLWMQDITATEMIMIIDACYSASAVGADFKPGPMGSRGLGQLAYDKDMKILSATQANNVALELSSLQQGLLSYAILQDGIVQSLADTDKNKQLLSTELLEYAEKRVPELYQEIKDGKRSVIINGKNVKGEKARSDIINLDENQKSSLNLQQPKIFDFKRRKKENNLFKLP